MVLNNEAVVKESRSFVRLIVRRPEAYAFRNRYKGTPIPGVVFLDGDGKVRDTYSFRGDNPVKRFRDKIKKTKG